MTTETQQTVEFAVPHPPNALRPNRRAAHWATRSKAADEYSEEVYAYAMGMAMGFNFGGVMTSAVYGCKPDGLKLRGGPWQRATVTYTWRYAGVAPDIDNIAGALKVLQDCLCMAPANGKPGRNRYFLGLIENDSGIEATFKREKVAHKDQQCVLVQITKRED